MKLKRAIQTICLKTVSAISFSKIWVVRVFLYFSFSVFRYFCLSVCFLCSAESKEMVFGKAFLTDFSNIVCRYTSDIFFHNEIYFRNDHCSSTLSRALITVLEFASFPSEKIRLIMFKHFKPNTKRLIFGFKCSSSWFC